MSGATREQVRQVRADALFGKKKHFNAADRKERLANILTIPVVVINLLIGSALSILVKDAVPEWAKWMGAFLALAAAVCAGIQGYLGLHKQVSGHRSVATRYLSLMKTCERRIAFLDDGLLAASALKAEIEELAKELSAINRDAQTFPTNQSDVALARKGIEDGEEEYTPQELSARR